MGPTGFRAKISEEWTLVMPKSCGASFGCRNSGKCVRLELFLSAFPFHFQLLEPGPKLRLHPYRLKVPGWVNIAPVNVPAHPSNGPLVGIIMGSRSDLETMQGAADTLRELEIPFEMRVVSAHRTPDLLFEYASSAESRGLEVIVAGAGGAAHLPGMCAAKTALPVLGVPVQSKMLSGVDSLLSIVQMPAGIPVGTLAIGRAGAVNAALLAASILGNKYPEIRARVHAYREAQTARVLEDSNLE
jgi:5-(carboxyamino)imidazole ribonucleotide mutase